MVKREIKLFFEGKFKESAWERPKLDGLSFKSLSERDKESRVREFDEEEIKSAV